jgi:hypothetical protein
MFLEPWGRILKPPAPGSSFFVLVKVASTQRQASSSRAAFESKPVKQFAISKTD